MDTSNPNIVLIISDSLRPKEMSMYGYNIETDKELKKIASECVVFENNFTASNASDSSVTALFSGQKPETSGFIHQHPFMKDEEIEKLKKNKFWLPIYLQKKGYRTISGTPLHLWFKKGFDFYMSKEDRGQNQFLDKPWIKKILLSLPAWAYKLGKKIVKKRASPQFYSSKEVIDLSISKIEESSDKPFFLFMHLVDTHYPYPAAEMKEIDSEETLAKIINKIPYSGQKEYVKKRFNDLNAENLDQIIKKRDDSIIEVSKNIFRFYSYLKDKKLWDNTIFVIFADHGDSFGEHNNYLCRGGAYDNVMKTPLIIHLPRNKENEGKRTNELTMNIDIPATILEVLGDKKNIDGRSLINLIKTGKKIREEIRIVDSYCEKRHSIRSKTKKRIITDEGGKCYLCGGEHHKEKIEEYDLVNDPDELNNIAKN